MGRSEVMGYVEAELVRNNFSNSVIQSDWTAQLEFRATGPERGGGNLQLWYAKDGPSSFATSSIYTVGNFDGVVLVIDPYGGKVPMLNSTLTWVVLIWIRVEVSAAS